MINNRSATILVAAIALLTTLPGRAPAQAPADPLASGFKDPPDSAKPRAWWHWLNGNITKEGITADLEWMKRANIAGMQMFDGSLGTPQFVDKRLVWMTPEWKDAFHHTPGPKPTAWGSKWPWPLRAGGARRQDRG